LLASSGVNQYTHFTMVQVSLDDPILEKKLLTMHPDGMSIFLLADGAMRGAFFHGTRFVNTVRAQHALGPLETMVLGQASLTAALLVPTMKGRDRVLFRYDTNGPAAGFRVEAFSEGYVRGYLLQNPIPVETPPDNWELAPYFGDGTVSITRFPEGVREPVTGSVPIIHKNISKDLAEYFIRSEQIPTAFNTGIQLDTSGQVVGAGGLYLQTMPGADPDIIRSAENAFRAAPSLGQWFAEGGDREDIIFGLFRALSPTVVLERDIVFNCPCSRDVYLFRLLQLDSTELDDMLENGSDPVEICCHNCGSIYSYTLEELKQARKRTKTEL